MTSAANPPQTPQWWRDEGVLKIVLQAIFAVAALLVGILLLRNLRVGLAKAGLSLGFSFLNNSANFAISEGIPYDPSDTYLWAFMVGAVNTLWVSSVSIVFATIMGFVLGMARLSSNWLAQRLAAIATEIFRNIPVLLVIYFWYFAVLLPLPRVRDSFSFFDVVFISQRGIYFPRLTPTVWLIPALIILAIVVVLAQKVRPDRPAWSRIGMALGGIAIVLGAFWILAPQPPLLFEIPELTRFNFEGGSSFSAEFLGLMLGLVTYTGAYIAEVVRGAFLAVPKGQWEASRALGFSELSTFQLVVVPQALRIMVPSLTTQFLTLIKNTTLAIAVAYPDLFNIGSTVINQAGRSIEVFAMVITTYLVINLSVSTAMNWFNNRVKLVER